jgi:hypothetical protein
MKKYHIVFSAQPGNKTPPSKKKSLSKKLDSNGENKDTTVEP